MEIKSTWFTPGATSSKGFGCGIGIIIVEDSEAYIGIVDGEAQKVDEKRILAYGSSFPLSVAEKLIEGR